MTAANMERRTSSPRIAFWRNLKEGYDFFEREGVPPDVTVVDGRYAFSE